MLCGKKAYVKRRLRALALLRFLSLALPGYLPPLLVCSPVAFGYLLLLYLRKQFAGHV